MRIVVDTVVNAVVEELREENEEVKQMEYMRHQAKAIGRRANACLVGIIINFIKNLIYLIITIIIEETSEGKQREGER